jgi:hypothetical protein
VVFPLGSGGSEKEVEFASTSSAGRPLTICCGWAICCERPQIAENAIPAPQAIATAKHFFISIAVSEQISSRLLNLDVPSSVSVASSIEG